MSKPITPIPNLHHNFSSPYQSSTNYYQPQTMQGNKVGGNELFKSSIYGASTQNSTTNGNGISEKASLNLSGGKPSSNFGMTPPRKMPRISEPSLPSDMNYYMEYMKGSNNNTADSTPLEKDKEQQQPSNFNKIRQFVVDSPNRSVNSTTTD